MEVRDILLRQKHDLDIELSNPFVKRNITIDDKTLESNIIKVVIGPRRAGKSTFVLRSIEKAKFAYINFDDERLIKIENYDDLLKYLKEIFGEFKYLILDEIQNVPGWELFLNRLQRSGYNMIITGSNSMLLSKELSTHLTGRHLDTLVLPFSFKEFLSAKKVEVKIKDNSVEEVGEIIRFLREYLDVGGFPELVIKNLNQKDYLNTLVDSVVLKDIVNRYNIRFSSLIYNLVKYLIENFSHEASLNSIKNTLHLNSVHTVDNYVRYICEAFLIFRINKFSVKSKERAGFGSKIYVIDNGIANAYSFRSSENIGKLMENTVAIELVRRSEFFKRFTVNYWRNVQKKEVDFVIKDGIRVRQLIQVTYASSKETIKNREIENLLVASSELKCSDLLVITWDYEAMETVKGKKIKFIPLWKWLLNLN